MVATRLDGRASTEQAGPRSHGTAFCPPLISWGSHAWGSAEDDVIKCAFWGGLGGYISKEVWEWSSVDVGAAVWHWDVVQGRGQWLGWVGSVAWGWGQTRAFEVVE